LTDALLWSQFFEASIHRWVSSTNEFDALVCIVASFTRDRVRLQVAPSVNDCLDSSQLFRAKPLDLLHELVPKRGKNSDAACETVPRLDLVRCSHALLIAAVSSKSFVAFFGFPVAPRHLLRLGNAIIA